jgi:hypothetical protein
MSMHLLRLIGWIVGATAGIVLMPTSLLISRWRIRTAQLLSRGMLIGMGVECFALSGIMGEANSLGWLTVSIDMLGWINYGLWLLAGSAFVATIFVGPHR